MDTDTKRILQKILQYHLTNSEIIRDYRKPDMDKFWKLYDSIEDTVIFPPNQSPKLPKPRSLFSEIIYEHGTVLGALLIGFAMVLVLARTLLS